MIVEEVRPGVKQYRMMANNSDLSPIRKRTSYKRLSKTEEELLTFLSKPKTVLEVGKFAEANLETVRYHLRKLVTQGKIEYSASSGESGTYHQYWTKK